MVICKIVSLGIKRSDFQCAIISLSIYCTVSSIFLSPSYSLDCDIAKWLAFSSNVFSPVHPSMKTIAWILFIFAEYTLNLTKDFHVVRTFKRSQHFLPKFKVYDHGLSPLLMQNPY